MSNYQKLSRELHAHGRCWSIEHRNFIIWRALALDEAKRVLGTAQGADRWLIHSARGLNYQSPCDVLSTPQGYQRVRTLLYQIEYGVYI
ncbi:MbcA/ParS/Xre antitoxin family protein [Pseudomonas bohemica]|uniref:MbcA/ParS/Xre antitoxin family protein n=1 Tax=Pseudomonas bohemica TaxID=2044872 RepID=UPI000DA615EA|nr:MbcA/ParS/Xre antitoxin family protein [Pseudomonas bohemica]